MKEIEIDKMIVGLLNDERSAFIMKHGFPPTELVIDKRVHGVLCRFYGYVSCVWDAPLHPGLFEWNGCKVTVYPKIKPPFAFSGYPGDRIEDIEEI